MPKTSIIITTFSRPKYLPRAVESAFAAGSDVEVIVVDDASTDATSEVCRSLEEIKYIRLEENQGTARARNIGIEASQGEYIAFHDDDDRRLPGSVDELAAILDADPAAGLAYGQIWAGDENLEPVGDPFPTEFIQGDVFWRIVEANFIPTIGTVFRKSCLSEVGMVKPDLVGVDDYDLWIRISEQYRILALEKPVGIWRQALANSGQGSSDKVLEAVRTNAVSNRALDTLPRAANDPDRREKAREGIRQRTSQFLYWYASEQYKEGHLKDSRKSILAALRFNIKPVFHPTVMRMLLRSFLPV